MNNEINNKPAAEENDSAPQKKPAKGKLIAAAVAGGIVLCGVAALLCVLASYHVVGGRLYDKDEFFVSGRTAYSFEDYFELNGEAYDRADYFELDGTAYDRESCFEFDGKSYPFAEYFAADGKLYDLENYFCLNDTAYAREDYFSVGDTAYDRAEWFEFDGAAYSFSEYYVASDRLYEIKEITLGGETFMSDVTRLELRTKGIEDISVLADCGKLEYLDLNSEYPGNSNYNRIEDISALSQLYNLKHLDLAGNKISDISALEKLTGLTYLDLEFNRIVDLAPLAGLTALTHLDVSNCYWCEQLEYYKTAQLYDCFTEITPLAGLVNLTYLDISYSLINDPLATETYLAPLAGMTDLEYLNISDIHMTYSGIDNLRFDISALSGLTKLETLIMTENRYIADFSPISELKNLKHLDLSFSSLYDSNGMIKPDFDISFLSGLNKLEFLRIFGTIGDISPLAGMTELKTLHLLSFYDRLKDISTLAALKKLEYLNVSLAVGIKDYSPLYELENFREIAVSWGCTEEQLIEMRREMPDCTVTPWS